MSIKTGAKLTRREFWKLVGIAGLASAAFDNSGNIGVISHERQQVLDEIVRNEPSPYVRRVIYDHHGSLSHKDEFEQFKKILGDPQFLEFLNRYSDNHYDYIILQKYLALNQNLSDLLRAFNNFYQNNSVENNAITNFYPPDFGKGVKSDIYCFGNLFNQLYIDCIQGDVGITTKGGLEIPAEEKIRMALRHEYAHAEQNFKGTNLGDGLVIDKSNYLNINSHVSKFVEEVGAYLSDVEFARQFGRDHPAYWYSVIEMITSTLSLHSKHIENRDLTYYELRLAHSQFSKVSEFSNEGENISKKIKSKLKC